MTIELRHLRWAIVASQHRSLRQAAEALNIRQSTLSRTIRDLEQCLGGALFERTNGGTHTTVAGREFLDSARHIVEETNTALARLRTRCRGESGQLAIGVYSSFSTGNLHATLIDHHRRYPEVDVHMVDGGRDRLLGELASNGIDVAIMTTLRSGWDDRVLPLWSERIVLAIEDRHPLCDVSDIRWSHLSNERLLLPHTDLGHELERILSNRLKGTVSPRIVYHESSLDRLLSLVSAGYGSLLILEGATGVRYDGVIYREVYDEDGPARLSFAAYWRSANSNPTLAPFVDMFRERYPDLSLARHPS